MQDHNVQLTLPVELPTEDTFDSYSSDANPLVIPYLKKFIQDTGYDNTNKAPYCVFYGLESVGKTHLLYASCLYANSFGQSSCYFDMDEISQLPTTIFTGIESKSIICIDNISSISSDADWQLAIFDLLNRVFEQNQNQLGKPKSKIIFSSMFSPKESGFTLPDLVSRLNWGSVFKLNKPSDKECMNLIKKACQKKGLNIDDEVIKFLMSRIDRDLKSVFDTLNKLDKKSLQENRRLTIPFVKKSLNL